MFASIRYAAAAFSIVIALVSNLAKAQTEILNNGTWIVTAMPLTTENPNPIAISRDGVAKGSFGEILVARRVGPGDFPQIFSIKGIGALRAVLLPPGEFGGTFYLTGYWDEDRGFLQNTYITSLNVRTPRRGQQGELAFTGAITNHSTFGAKDFALSILAPQAQQVKAKVSYTLRATSDFRVDPNRQNIDEGFKLARIASNFLSESVLDSDFATYVNSDLDQVCADLVNESDFIFSNPLPLGRPYFALGHSTSTPRNTPTLAVQFLQPAFGDIVPQGFMSESQDPNDDNVDCWGNWSAAEPEYAAGETIGHLSFNLIARPPIPSPCD